MGITYDKNTQTFHLFNKKISYFLKVTPAGHIAHLYWGKRLHVLNLDYLLKAKDFDVYLEQYEDLQNCQLESLPQEYPSFGNNDLRSPAIEVTYENGSSISDFRYHSHSIIPGKPKLDGLPATYVNEDGEADTLMITLHDEVENLDLVLSYTIYQNYDVITRSARIINCGQKTVFVRRLLSCSVDFYDEQFDFIHLSGAWARERHMQRNAVRPGMQSIESRRGASSHGQNPFIALAHKDCGEHHGEVYAFSLVYSGNFAANVEADVYDRIRVQMGINPFEFCWQLEANKSLQSPEVVMVYSDAGLNGMSQTFHTLYKNRLVRGRYQYEPRPVLINNWEATYFDFNEKKILEIAHKAKSLGVELFVLDDGWFGNRSSDNSSLGDWQVNETKLKGGLKKLADDIEELGMKFGLWFEPEMISPESRLYEKHPDWCIHVPKRHRSLARTQCVLDLSRDEVCDFILDMMTKTLSSAKISYVKWDYNRNFSELYSIAYPASKQMEIAHRYILNLYRLLEELTTRFPDVLFESCAGGGGRYDPGMLYYMPQTWTSDDTDALERLKIQYGTSMVYPPASMSCHVSAVPNHQVQRVTSLKTRGIVAMSGNFGYELDITKLSEEECREVAEQIALYKRIRTTIQFGKLTRYTNPSVDNAVVWMYTSHDECEIVVNMVRQYAHPYPKTTMLKLRGLCIDAQYQVEGDPRVYTGEELSQLGLILPDFSGDYDSVQWILHKVV